MNAPILAALFTTTTTVRLDRAAVGKYSPDRAPKFDVFLDGELLLATMWPLTAGARALLARGWDPNRLMTVRVIGRDYDSFKPIRIGDAAKWTVEESDKGGLRLRPWKPYHVLRMPFAPGCIDQ